LTSGRLCEPILFSRVQMSEKRKHKRSVLVSYFDAIDDENKSVVGYLVDISPGGLMLISKKPLETGRAMTLTIDIPAEIDESRQLCVKATGIRSLKDVDFDYFNTGFIMESTTPENQKIIDNLIAAFEL